MMDLKKNSVEYERWLAWYETTPRVSFFESPHWYPLWTDDVEVHGHASEIHSFWARKKVLGLPILHAAPLHTYGAVNAFFERHYLPKNASYFLTFNPFREHHYLSSLTSQTQNTYYVDLSKSNNELISQLPKKKRDNLKNSLKKCHKNNIQFSSSEALSDWVSFQNLYLETTKRWETPSKMYGAEDFERIHRLNPIHRTLYLAYQNNVPVAGAVCFFSNDICSFWLSAADNRGLKTGAVYGLVYHIINHARDSGRSIFDLLPSGKNPGVESFKQNLGGSPLPVHYVHHWHPIHKAAYATKSLLKF